ncbi:MAG TPA: RnfABCDGE type electron transport complex subunit G [Clostridiales bacterium]|nr:RnfABCDGE type electron transport complex subunit G [Clostridiales bacterium]
MRDILNLGIRLFIITVVAVFCLAITNAYTKEPIRITAENANNEVRRMALPQAQNFEVVDIQGKNIDGFSNILEVYTGLDPQGQVIGYTVKTISKGYGGDVEVIVGIKKDGKISSVQIGDHSETPGLGSKATEPGFIDQFVGKSASESLALSKSSAAADNEIQAVTGATVTSQAVINGVNTAIQFYNEILK